MQTRLWSLSLSLDEAGERTCLTCSSIYANSCRRVNFLVENYFHLLFSNFEKKYNVAH